MEIEDMWDDDEDRDSNTDAPIKSDHARLLNRLAEMQRVPYYATARCELALAEQTILQLEAENAKLKTAANAGEESTPTARAVDKLPHGMVLRFGRTL